jgi:hypothetical protein
MKSATFRAVGVIRRRLASAVDAFARAPPADPPALLQAHKRSAHPKSAAVQKLGILQRQSLSHFDARHQLPVMEDVPAVL